MIIKYREREPVATRQNYSASTNLGLILFKLGTFGAYSTCLFLEECLRTQNMELLPAAKVLNFNNNNNNNNN